MWHYSSSTGPGTLPLEVTLLLTRSNTQVRQQHSRPRGMSPVAKPCPLPLRTPAPGCGLVCHARRIVMVGMLAVVAEIHFETP